MKFPLAFCITLCYYVFGKDWMFRGFLPEKVYFLPLQKSVFTVFDFSVLTKGAALRKPTLVQNTQGGCCVSVPEGLPAGGCARHAIKIHFGGI